MPLRIGPCPTCGSTDRYKCGSCRPCKLAYAASRVEIIKGRVRKVPAKPCRACGQSNRFPNGRCRPCQQAKNARWLAANVERTQATAKAWHAANKDRKNAMERARYAATDRERLRARKADHGVPQHRERLFLVLTRSKHPLELKLPRRDHVPASSVIDFGGAGWSPIHKPGRSLATLQRIAAGRAKFGQRFVMPYYGSGSGLTGRSLSRPIGTITTKNRWGVVDGDRMRMLAADETRGFMGFPESYRLPAGVTEATFMLGNAVCPPVARDVIHAIREAA